ncbi:MAG: cytosine deaminase [Alphaproteobacteria bacterium]|nr:cytosine deaminase [Alphaproteobacteria bacterium]
MAYQWPPSPMPASGGVLRRASVPTCMLDPVPDGARAGVEGLALVDIAIADGRLSWVRPAAEGEAAAGDIELLHNQVWPCFVDMHTHLDKGHIWPRAENPDGTMDSAVAAVVGDHAHWTAADVAARMSFGLRAAYAHGTSAIRTHIDSHSPQHEVSWPVFARMREEWRGRIALQAVTIILLDQLEGPFGAQLADWVARHDGVLGAVALPAPALSAQLDRIFALAAMRNLELDFHADETGNAAAVALRAIAEAKLRHRFAGRVVVGHCCSLARQTESEIDRTLDLVAEAGLAVVSLPMCNLYLQDRTPGRTPRWRGVTLLHEMRARGIALALASDNCRDPFYGYGDHDGLEVFQQAARIAHLDRPVGDWPAAVTRTPADVIGSASLGRVKAGAPADLVLFNARGYSELLSRPQSDRVVLRAGRPIDTSLPSYRELDAVVAPP